MKLSGTRANPTPVEVGRRGFAHKPFPLSPALLLDGGILTSEAFQSKGEKDSQYDGAPTLKNCAFDAYYLVRCIEDGASELWWKRCIEDSVPVWRDGHSGRELQKAMVVVLSERLFQFGTLEQCVMSNKSAFASGAAWAAFARLNGPPYYHLTAVLEKLFDSKDRWSDSVRTLHRAIWVGEHDLEVLRMCTLFPATFDGQPQQMQKRVAELFPPILTLLQQKETDASRLQTAAENNADSAAAEDEQTSAATDSTQSLQSVSLTVMSPRTPLPIRTQQARGHCARHSTMTQRTTWLRLWMRSCVQVLHKSSAVGSTLSTR